MERALYNLEVSVKLLLFPNEGHLMSNNPWYAKTKFQEKIKWLQKYGLNSTFAKKKLSLKNTFFNHICFF